MQTLKEKFGTKNLVYMAILAAALIVLIALLIIRGIKANVEDAQPVISTVTGEAAPSDDEALALQAQRLAAMYDYDTALDLINEYESNHSGCDFEALKQKIEGQKALVSRWADTTQVPHIFFHSLIADTDRAFDGDYDSDGYNVYMTTISEFKAIMQQMYDSGYVLIDIHDMVKETVNSNGQTVFEQGDIYLPEGKKPFVLSVDDVNYYSYMTDSDDDMMPDAGSDGFAHKLVINDEGRVVNEYYEKDGTLVTGSYDVLPLLEDFIDEHPDFSYRGAKGILGVTGYEGVFGYHTHPDWKDKMSAEEYEKEVSVAKEVSQAIKDSGWTIASHSYAHIAYGKQDAGTIAYDVQRWEEQIQPIVGDTDVFIYPFGNDISGLDGYSGAKFDSMYNAGYRFFCNVDASCPYWVQIHDTYMRQGRINLDGYRLYHTPGLVDELIDAESVLDPARPLPVPSV